MTELQELNSNLDLTVKKVKNQPNLVAEKVFQSRNSKGRVARDIIKEIRQEINKEERTISSAQYINYQSVENIEGEYYLLRQDKNLLPLKKYLADNQVEIETIISWWKSILDLFKKAKKLNLQWEGIVPASLWVNEQQEICIIDPLITKKIEHYREEIKFDYKENILLPPEVLEGDNWSPESQIYSISAFFYYLLTGQPLFEEEASGKVMAKIKNIKPLKPQIINPELSPALSELLSKCLIKKKEQRVKSFDKLIDQLQNLRHNKQLISSPAERDAIKKKQGVMKTLFKFKASLFWYVYRYGKLTTVIMVAVGVLVSFALSGGYDPVIDETTSSQQVVNYFYEAIDTKNNNLFGETIASEELPHIESMVRNGYIIETAKNLFSAPPPSAHEDNDQQQNNNNQQHQDVPEKKKRVFEIKELTIKQVESGATPQYKANYYFIFSEKDQTARIKMQDQLILTKKEDQWEIKKIRGDISKRQFLRKKEKKLKGK